MNHDEVAAKSTLNHVQKRETEAKKMAKSR